MGRHSAIHKNTLVCIYCKQPFKPTHQKYTVANNNGQNVGILHSYCHPYVQDDFGAKLFTVKTNLGVMIKPKR